jgi:hypothetical protein
LVIKSAWHLKGVIVSLIMPGRTVALVNERFITFITEGAKKKYFTSRDKRFKQTFIIINSLVLNLDYLSSLNSFQQILTKLVEILLL